MELGFFTNSDEIDERLTPEFKDVFESFELQVVAIWVTNDTTEIFFCETDPDDVTLSRIEQLSQSFIE